MELVTQQNAGTILHRYDSALASPERSPLLDPVFIRLDSSCVHLLVQVSQRYTWVPVAVQNRAPAHMTTYYTATKAVYETLTVNHMVEGNNASILYSEDPIERMEALARWLRNRTHTPKPQASILSTINDLRKRAKELEDFEKALSEPGLELDPSDIYPPEMWQASTRPEHILPLLTELELRIDKL